jgi:hypothetical protein
MKKLSKRGKSTSKCEVLAATPFGVWLLFNKTEYYLNYHEFPWFRKSSLEEILNVKALSSDHLYWPDLDIDLHIDSIKEPQKYPLIAKRKIKTKSNGKKVKVA